jgi:hypothetical protein
MALRRAGLVLMDGGLEKVINYEQTQSTACAMAQQITIHRGFCPFLDNYA